MTGRLAAARPAVRPALKGRAMLSGPPGAGKTRTALIIAETLAGPDGRILMIDTEKESALTYADDFTFDHVRWLAPFDPRELGREMPKAGQDYDVVIVDSTSHFWTGDGGVLDIADGKYTGWKDARPAQADLVEGILACDAHVILCVRSKIAHEQVQEGGKWVVKKLGMSPIQDDTLEYEINVSLSIEMDHSLIVAKSRSIAVPVGRSFKAGHAEDFAVAYRDWLAGGADMADPAVVEDITARLNALPEKQRREAKAEFKAQFGRPTQLTEAMADEAVGLVDRWETAVAALTPAPDDASALDPAEAAG